MLMPLLAWRGRGLLRSSQLGLYGVRVAVSLLSMLAWFYAISLIPIGEVTAISFLAPLFGTLGAILLLGEKVRMRRWAALIIGFAGAMIILRPGGTPIGIGQICAMVSAMIDGRDRRADQAAHRARRSRQDRVPHQPDADAAVAGAGAVRVELADRGDAAAAARHGAVRGGRPRRAGARLCGHRRLAGADLRVLAPAVHRGASPISPSARPSTSGPGSARSSSSHLRSTSRAAKRSSSARRCRPSSTPRRASKPRRCLSSGGTRVLRARSASNRNCVRVPVAQCREAGRNRRNKRRRI